MKCPLVQDGELKLLVFRIGSLRKVRDLIGISKTNTTNLAVVAPGIAEALLATAMGLIAAIPAVVMYNAFARAITGYRALLGDAAAEVLRHLSRDLDREVFPLKDEAPIVSLRQSAERSFMAMRLSLEEDRVEETHEINVTPFIDVILVLLIIFMVAAPLSTVDVDVDLPASTAQPAPRPEKPLFLTLKADLSLMLGEAPVKREELGSALDRAAQGDKDQRVFVRADRAVSYGEMMDLMNLLRGAGYLKIGLVGMEAGPAAGASSVTEASTPSEVKGPNTPSETKP